MKKRRSHLHLVGDNPTQTFDDLKQLRQEQGEQPLLVRRGRSRETFARLPHTKALTLYQRHHLRPAAWALLIEIDYLILKSGGQNPIGLSSSRLRAIGLTHHTRQRALRDLEKAGVISVQRRSAGHGPLITHSWFPRS